METEKKIIFIAGSDTEIGKTHITHHLVKAFQENKLRVCTQKWVQCGPSPHDLDAHKCILETHLLNKRLPYHFQQEVSPHLAAELNKSKIIKEKLMLASYSLAKQHDILLIEGSGGLMVPLSNNLLIIDLIAEMKLPVILVVPNRIGTINQSLIHLKALKTYKVKCLGVLLNQHQNNSISESMKQDHVKQIEHFASPVKVISSFNFNQEPVNLKKIGQTILSRLLSEEKYL